MRSWICDLRCVRCGTFQWCWLRRARIRPRECRGAVKLSSIVVVIITGAAKREAEDPRTKPTDKEHEKEKRDGSPYDCVSGIAVVVHYRCGRAGALARFAGT